MKTPLGYGLAAAFVFLLALRAAVAGPIEEFGDRVAAAATIIFKGAMAAGAETYDIAMPAADGTLTHVQISAKAITVYMRSFDIDVDGRPEKQPAPRQSADGTLVPVAAIGKHQTRDDKGKIFLYAPGVNADVNTLARILLHEILALEEPLRPYNAAYVEKGWPPQVEAQMQSVMDHIFASQIGAVSTLAGEPSVACRSAGPGSYTCRAQP